MIHIDTAAGAAEESISPQVPSVPSGVDVLGGPIRASIPNR